MASSQQLAQGLRSIAQQQPVMMGNPALSGAEQYGDIMKPATASTTKKLAAGLRAAVDAMGGPLSARMAAHAEQQKARMAAGDYSPTPLTGESIDLADSVAGSLVGNIGLAGALRAYHGSPHRFDRFDMSKIGTGEGAQAYGHGLYFAESEGVAKSYRQKLAGARINAKISIDGKRFKRTEKDGFPAYFVGKQEIDQSMASAIELFHEHGSADAALEYMKGWKDTSINNDIRSNLQKLRDNRVVIQEPGALYTTKLNVEPDDLLDWDKPLSEQSEKVQKLAAEELGLWTSDSPARQAHVREKLSGSGDWFYRKLVAEKGSHEAASSALREAGIPGIRYLDQGSRASGKGTRNFVIFDDSLVDITHVDGKPLTKAERAEAVEAMMGGGDALPMDQASRMARAKEMGFDVENPVFHGTKGDIGSFDPAFLGAHTGSSGSEHGFFVTSRPSVAETYAESAIRPGWVNARNKVREELSAAVEKWKKMKLSDDDSPAFMDEYEAAAQRVHDLNRVEGIIGRVGATNDGAFANAAKTMEALVDPKIFTDETGKLFKEGGAAIYPLYTKLDKPMTIDANGKTWDDLERPMSFYIKKAKSEGFDGVVFRNLYDAMKGMMGEAGRSDVSVIFDPKNIRSVHAKFDPAKRNSSDLLAGVAGGAVAVGAAAKAKSDDKRKKKPDA